MFKHSITLVIAAAMISISAQADALFDNYSFETARVAYLTATAPVANDARLVNTWWIVGASSHSFRGDFVKKDAAGMKSPDGSTPGIVFAYVDRSLIVQASFINNGAIDRDQNNLPVTFVDGQFAAATISSYTPQGAYDDVVAFTSECKIYSATELLCGKRFIALKPERLNPQQRALHNTIVGYDLYRLF